jgi:NADH-quinone oxidoreductase subunit G
MATANGAWERVADVPIYFTDSIVRRAPSLQKTHDAAAPRAWMSSAAMSKLGLTAGARVKVKQNGGEALLELACDDRLPATCVRVAAGHATTAGLGAMSGSLTVERA